MRDFIKKSIRDMEGYVSPPQQDYRIKLNQNESPFDVPEALKQAIVQKASGIPWNRYPLNASPELRQKLALRHGVEKSCILLGNGSNQLFQTLLTATLEPGDKVLYCPPTFSLFQEFTEIYEGDLVDVLCPPGEDFPMKSVLENVERNHPKLILLCSPNNPTGSEISLDRIGEICDAAPGLVFCDEAYGEFSSQSTCELLQRFPGLVISRTFSKAFSIAGLRFGYLIANPDIIRQLQKANLPYNVNLFTENAVMILLEHSRFMVDQVEYLIKERERLFIALSEMNEIRVFSSAANFLLFRYPEGRDLFSELQAKGVLVRDLKGYPLLENHARLTVGSTEENDLFLRILNEIL